MQNSLVLEVCVESIDHAVAAERGGAHRIELCSDLASGGITPSAGLIETARHHLRLPIHVLIRPRAGGFFYSDYEFEIIERDIHMAKRLRIDGIVLGLLDENGRVDVPRTRKLVDLARPLPVTFHRAFDECQDMDACLEAVIQTGAARILTSAGQARASDAIAALAHLVRAAGDRTVVMPGGGVDADNVHLILQQTAAREIHTSLGLSAAATNHASGLSGEVLGAGGGDSSEFEGRVRKVRELLEAIQVEVCPRG
ncbi:MAG TPA: copper homeostasis protein CutC [Terriglobales bacterium]|nr:copper homeostasis protein CutC [Terriglobales bacterium]